MTEITYPQVRFPDAITIKYGPIPLLSRFFLAADQYVRDRGIRLTICYDMEALAELNRQEQIKGTWYPLPRGYDPAFNDIDPGTCYWVQGANDKGETVLSHCGRIYDWTDSSVADHAVQLIYGDNADPETPCIVECAAAHEVTGRIYAGGGLWIHPDYRRFGLGRLAPHISRTYALANWNADWSMCFVTRQGFENKMDKAYGYHDTTWGIKYPKSPWGDPLELALARMPRSNVLPEIELFLSTVLAPSAGEIAA